MCPVETPSMSGKQLPDKSTYWYVPPKRTGPVAKVQHTQTSRRQSINVCIPRVKGSGNSLHTVSGVVFRVLLPILTRVHVTHPPLFRRRFTTLTSLLEKTHFLFVHEVFMFNPVVKRESLQKSVCNRANKGVDDRFKVFSSQQYIQNILLV